MMSLVTAHNPALVQCSRVKCKDHISQYINDWKNDLKICRNFNLGKSYVEKMGRDWDPLPKGEDDQGFAWVSDVAEANSQDHVCRDMNAHLCPDAGGCPPTVRHLPVVRP